MMTRRDTLLSAAVTALLLSAPTVAAAAAEDDVSKLPRQKVELVAPPFVHAHQQATKDGPKVVEFKMVVQEKEVVIDEDGNENGVTF